VDVEDKEYGAACQQLRGDHTHDAVAAGEALRLVHGVLTEARRASNDQAACAIKPADLLAALTVLRHLRGELASWEPQLITIARNQGLSWVNLAPALGVTSRQAAERRYLRLQPSATGEHTGEARVQAERDKRAGDRAVAAWARANSAALRELAGQLSALDGLTGQARQHVDLIQQALGDNDPATLLSPLTDTQSHLKASHPGLAERIRSVAERTAQVRRETHDRRSATDLG
jgi:hypothetical protein